MLLGAGGFIVALDQWTKYLIRANLAFGEVFMPDFWLTQYVRLIHWKNTGAVFGIFQNMGDVFMVLSFIVAAAILYFFPQVPRKDWGLRLAMCLQFGGAIGNLIDRLTRGYVTDFVSVGNFAVFNVADACISMGVAVLVLDLLIRDQREKRAVAAQPAEALLSSMNGEAEALVEPEEGKSE